MKSFKITVLGCGGSGGVPYAGNVWGVCDPSNAKNHRTRPSILISDGVTNIVIDTGPEFRIQSNRANIDHIDAVLYTHAHNDHVIGIDDLRAFWVKRNKSPVAIYGTKETIDTLKYCFNYVLQGDGQYYPPIVEAHILPDTLYLGDFTVTHFHQIHGNNTTTGFRIGDFAYCTDVNRMPPESIEALKGVKTWIVGNYPTEEGAHNHAGFAQIKSWIDVIKPDMTYLTHLTAYADYDTLCRDLPAHIRPCYDGMELEVLLMPPIL